MKKTREVILEQQAINRKLWADNNGRMHHDDGNKLIAEFMGVTQGKHTHFMVEPFTLESYADVDALKYDISWDWLMPVIENIDHLQYESVKSIEDALSTRQIGDTHKAVVEFIKKSNK